MGGEHYSAKVPEGLGQYTSIRANFRKKKEGQKDDISNKVRSSFGART